ncbi:MAG: YceI family protein [Bifidobacteriaceae bacterium]|jgi:polyisoprenoid-binding protein YceI|nr:YceI family protein [Bifidobacteriaceae bacterium]
MTQTLPPPTGTISDSLADLRQGTWLIDPRHSSVHFEVAHAYIARIHGIIPVSGGAISVGEDLANSSVNLAFEPAGVYTGLGERDDRLRGPNFFDVDTFPVWSFRSTAISGKGHDLLVRGDLTVHGETAAVQFDAQFTGVDESRDGAPVAGFIAKAKIDRRDFGLTWTAEQAGSHVRTGHTVSVDIYLVASPVGPSWEDVVVEVFDV